MSKTILEFIDLPPSHPSLDRHVSLPNISASLKLQELPEFRALRAQHSLIEPHDKYENAKRMEEATHGYDEIKLEKMPSVFQSMYVQEYASAAKSIWELLKLRDKYMFKHCQCKNFYS